MSRHQLHISFGAVGLLLSVASALVVLRGASDEPYSTFRASDALIQIGAAMILMVLWLQLAAFLVWAVATRRIGRLWLALLLWIALCEFILFDSPSGYVQDITTFGGTP